MSKSVLFLALFFLFPSDILGIIDVRVPRTCYFCNNTACENPPKIECELRNQYCVWLTHEEDDREYRFCWDDERDCNEMKREYNATFCMLCAADKCNSTPPPESSLFTSFVIPFTVFFINRT